MSRGALLWLMAMGLSACPFECTGADGERIELCDLHHPSCDASVAQAPQRPADANDGGLDDDGGPDADSPDAPGGGDAAVLGCGEMCRQRCTGDSGYDPNCFTICLSTSCGGG